MIKKGSVFFKDVLVGEIEEGSDRSFEYRYDTQNQNSVSWTLPRQQSVYQAEDLFPFFDGLIPEGWLLNLLTKNWKIKANDRMGLLLVACQDCVGAAHVESKVKITSAQHHLKNSNKPLPQNSHCLICAEPLKKNEVSTHTRCARQLYGTAEMPFVDVTLADLEKLALQQINQRSTLTGVQKKLSLSPFVNEEKLERLTIAGLDGRYILKPPSDEFPEMPQIEHLSMKLAELQGLNMAKCGLIPLASGELAYITRRFDRQDGEKLQMEDFCQLSGKPTAKKYDGSSESLGKVIDKYSGQAADDKLTLFQMILFSFWIGNTDMHLKNFSLWQDPESQSVRMSPGYDFLSVRLLISKKEDLEELALPVNGRKNKLNWADFKALGSHLKIPDKVQSRVRDQLLDSLPESEKWIEKSFLSISKKREFIQLLRQHSKRLV